MSQHLIEQQTSIQLHGKTTKERSQNWMKMFHTDQIQVMMERLLQKLKHDTNIHTMDGLQQHEQQYEMQHIQQHMMQNVPHIITIKAQRIKHLKMELQLNLLQVRHWQLMQMHELQKNLYVYLTQQDEQRVLRNENYQNMLNINKYHEHEHGILILILMNEQYVIGSVYDHTTEKEMYVNLTDEVVEDHEEVHTLVETYQLTQQLITMINHLQVQATLIVQILQRYVHSNVNHDILEMEKHVQHEIVVEETTKKKQNSDDRLVINVQFLELTYQLKKQQHTCMHVKTISLLSEISTKLDQETS